MTPPPGNAKNDSIGVMLKKVGDRYESVDGSVERISGKRGKVIRWWIANPTVDTVDVLVHKFAVKADGSPVSAPVTFAGGAGPRTIRSGEAVTLTAKILDTAKVADYTYEIDVTNAGTKKGGPIDPELQIDGFLVPLKILIGILVAIGALLWLAFWFWPE